MAESTSSTTKADDAKVESTVKKVESVIDKENEKGYRGTQVDKTPNENYTVAGVTAGKPTPETDTK